MRAVDENVLNSVRSKVGRNKSSQFRHEPNVMQPPEQRKALFRPTGATRLTTTLYQAIELLGVVVQQFSLIDFAAIADHFH